MQNAVNQNKQTRIAPLRSAASYLFRFGNYRGNGLVTQILLYLAISCFLTKQQIRAFQLIINELRFIRCTSLVTVSAVITHYTLPYFLDNYECGADNVYLFITCFFGIDKWILIS